MIGEGRKRITVRWCAIGLYGAPAIVFRRPHSYLLARLGLNERRPVKPARLAGVNGLATVLMLFLTPPKAGSKTRSTAWPVRRSMARMFVSSTGVTSVMARPVLPARPVRPMRCT